MSPLLCKQVAARLTELGMPASAMAEKMPEFLEGKILLMVTGLPQQGFAAWMLSPEFPYQSAVSLLFHVVHRAKTKGMAGLAASFMVSDEVAEMDTPPKKRKSRRRRKKPPGESS